MAVVFDNDVVDLIALDEVLGRLEKIDKLKSEVVELKFFGGLTIDEIAEVTNTSNRHSRTRMGLCARLALQDSDRRNDSTESQ